MPDNVAIKVEHVSKTFRLPHEKQSSLKSTLINFKKRGYENQRALNDISFEIQKGEFFGIVGRNGSGKSTLLKLLAGIYTPSKGNIQINGKLTPFIELGVGFNPELTGRENVFLNGALLGFNRKEMATMYDEIVEFADLKRFMDQKLKNYSSGMQVRLAFSIAIRAQSDILVLDEVLAVGDAAFQQKCNDYFEKQKANKQTIVLVTHDMGNIEKYCTRALLLETGEIVKMGSPEDVASEYTQLNQINTITELESQKQTQYDELKLVIQNDQGQETKSFDIGETMQLVVSWKSSEVKNVGVVLYKQSGERMFATNTQKDKHALHGDTCTYSLKLDVAPGKYYLRIRAFGKDELETIALIGEGPVIFVKQASQKVDGLVPLQYGWKG